MTARLRPLWPLLLLLPLLIPTLVSSPYYVNGIVNRILIYAMLVASLDLMVGYVGDVSIGHAGFFAIGAYTVAVLTARPEFNSDSALAHYPQLPFLVALVPAVLLAAFAGFLLGFPALRSSGPYLAVITIAFDSEKISISRAAHPTPEQALVPYLDITSKPVLTRLRRSRRRRTGAT